MRFISRNFIGFVLLLCGPSVGFADQGPYPQTEAEMDAAFDALTVDTEPGRYQLTGSSSELSLLDGQILLLGESAERYEFLVNGAEFPDTEAVVLDSETGQKVNFKYVDTGYVQDDDWSDLDPQALLQELQEGNEAANEERVKNGTTPIHIKGWVQEPTYDRANNMVHWILELNDGGEPFVNAATLRLNRFGYHHLTWVATVEETKANWTLRDTVIEMHKYNEGSRYADFITGDKIAGVGLASLVAVSAGSKQGRGLIAGIIAAAVLILKKGWFVVLAVLAGGFAGLRRLFTPRRDRRSF